MNEHEAIRVAAAVHRLRPDWPEAQVLTLIREKLIDRPRRDVAVALTWVACERDSATPYRVLEAGPWWKAVGGWADDQRAPRPPKPAEACRDCGRHYDRCACEGGPTIRPVLPTADTSRAVERLRREAEAARAELCPCGIPPLTCNDHRATTEGA